MGAQVSDAQIFRMVTESAARCLGSHQLGWVEVDAPADFFVVRSPISADRALRVVGAVLAS